MTAKTNEQRLYAAAKAYRDLNICYRISKPPSERLMKALVEANKTMIELENP